VLIRAPCLPIPSSAARQGAVQRTVEDAYDAPNRHTIDVPNWPTRMGPTYAFGVTR
jgi:hypothetical protein